MAATANVQVRMDADLKKAAENMFKGMGLSMSAAINLFIRQSVVQGKIPFEILSADIPNEVTRRAMEDTMAGRKLSREFNTVDEMWEDVLA